MKKIYYQIPDVFYEHLAKITTLARTRNADVSIDWTRIAGFHKNKTFDTEKEVRILTVDPFESMAEKTEFQRMDYRAEKGRNRMTYFFSYRFG